MSTSTFLPLLVNLKDKSILVVGANVASARKVKQLLAYGARVTVVALEFDEQFRSIECAKLLEGFSESLLIEQDFVWAYTSSKSLNKEILDLCAVKKILCSISDYKELSDFKSPAIWNHGSTTFAISSTANDYTQSIAWRNRIKDLLTCGIHDKPKVFLIGFGPGNSDLMTLKAHQILDQADAVFYDDLIDPTVLELYTCEKIYVGKRKGLHYKSQDEINELIYQKACEDKLVVRLKGGDPFIFGRGGEELLYLSTRGICVEIVPGVTSALAASASAKVPLTMRMTSRSVAFQTAHHLDDEKTALPKADTIVLYMGATKLKYLKSKLIEEKWSKDTGVLLVQSASQKEERSEFLTIDTMDETKLGSPLCIVIGNVVTEFSGIV